MTITKNNGVMALTPSEIIAQLKSQNILEGSNTSKDYKALQFLLDNVKLLDSAKRYTLTLTSKGNINTGYLCELIAKNVYKSCINSDKVSTRNEYDIVLSNGSNIEVKSIINPSRPGADIRKELLNDNIKYYLILTLKGFYKLDKQEIYKHINDKQCFKIEKDGRLRPKAYLAETYGKKDYKLTSQLKLR